MENDRPYHGHGCGHGLGPLSLTLVRGKITSKGPTSRRNATPLSPEPTLTSEQLSFVTWGEWVAMEETFLLAQKKCQRVYNRE